MADVHHQNLKFSFHGGEAAKGRLPIYDAGLSNYGISRALGITAYAFFNRDVRTKAERIPGVQIYLVAARRGSFEQIVQIVIENPWATSLGVGYVGNALWDFTKFAWSRAVNREVEPTTPYVRRFVSEHDELTEQLAAGLESAIADMHRPIATDSDVRLDVRRPKSHDFMEFDTKSLEQVSTQEEPGLTNDVVGNITKYNIISGYGRFYDDRLERTVPVILDSSSSVDARELLTWSLDQRNRGYDGKVSVDVKRTLTARGDVKRYRIYRARELEAAEENDAPSL